MSIRGSIVDLFSPGARNPLRVEFFADRVNSLREFFPSTQKSIGKTKKAAINPASFAFYRQRSKDALVKQILTGADKRGLTSSEVEPLIEAFENGSYFREIEWFTPFFWDSRQCVLDYPQEDIIISLPFGFDEDALLSKLEEKFEARRKSLGKLEKSLPSFKKTLSQGKRTCRKTRAIKARIPRHGGNRGRRKKQALNSAPKKYRFQNLHSRSL